MILGKFVLSQYHKTLRGMRTAAYNEVVVCDRRRHKNVRSTFFVVGGIGEFEFKRRKKMTYLMLIIGFILLIKGADFFVDGSSSVAKLLKVPAIVIGLTVVAFGTSMPEASVSITAALQGKNDLAVSNVIGSNIFNLLVVLGASAFVCPIKANVSVLKKEFPFSIIATIILLVMMIPLSIKELLGGSGEFILGRVDGIVLLVLFAVFVANAVRDALKYRNDYKENEEEEIKAMSPAKSSVYILAGLAGIIIGGDLVVESATDIARTFGLSETFIGLTIVALGTSLPELVTSLVAAKKGENDLALGNVVGSNLFNILLIVGASCAILPITVQMTAICDTIILAIVSVIGYGMTLSKGEISKKEGIVFLLMYVSFFVYILMR